MSYSLTTEYAEKEPVAAQSIRLRQKHTTAGRHEKDMTLTDGETSYPGFSGGVSGHRLYSPVLERWLNRDPVGERWGNNLYWLCKNNGINEWDLLGLKEGYEVLCDQAKDDGFKTPGETKLIEIIKKKKCKIPEIYCDSCCPKDENGSYDPKANKVKLCARKGKTRADYQFVRRHELQHATDYCEEPYDCKTPGGQSRLLCSEIRAYTWGDGMKKEDAIKQAVLSLLKACTGKAFEPDNPFNQNDLLLYKQALADAAKMYEACASHGKPGAIPDEY